MEKAELFLEWYGNVQVQAQSLELNIWLLLVEKTELFLELFGNIQVRMQSLDYVEKMSTEFIR